MNSIPPQAIRIEELICPKDKKWNRDGPWGGGFGVFLAPTEVFCGTSRKRRGREIFFFLGKAGFLDSAMELDESSMDHDDACSSMKKLV